MKLATLRDGTRDGRLHVVRADGKKMTPAPAPWLTLQAALDAWDKAEPALRNVAANFDAHGAATAIDVDPARLAAPLPRAYEWIDGSAYLNHVRLVRKARKAEPPPTLETDPLVYQGGSSEMLGCRDDIRLGDPAWGLDFEAEVCAVLGDVPFGTTAAQAAPYVRLLMICNDVSLRNLIPDELAKGFGFFQSKPATAFAPFAITPDELGAAWKDGRAHIAMRCVYNGKEVGNCNAGPEMHFSFFDLIAHLAKTRNYTAGTILGSGTISNADLKHGISCLAEQRMIETINDGKPTTPFMQAGETIAIRAELASGDAPWGSIEQTVKPLEQTSRTPVR
ncbi:MAG: fumarylacetoacetate hydrolase family protein [Myxococcales bacterium]|nr:fumarylacetoacetate hydrolase family protein [Myxococcales bacterium]